MPTRSRSEPNERRTRADELLLGGLAAGSPVEQAAEAAGLSTRTAYRRLADPAFARRLARARDTLITSALGELVECGTPARPAATSRDCFCPGCGERVERLTIALAFDPHCRGDATGAVGAEAGP